MDRVRRRLGEHVPVELVFPREPADGQDGDGLPALSPASPCSASDDESSCCAHLSADSSSLVFAGYGTADSSLVFAPVVDDSADSDALHDLEAELVLAAKVAVCRPLGRRLPVVAVRARSRSLGDVRDVGVALQADAGAGAPAPGADHLAKTRVPFLWRKKLEVIIETDAAEEL
jgi:hypothetical protein